MDSAPKPFWVLAGIAVALIGGALAYRIATGSQPVAVTGNKDGVSVTLGEAESSISDAQASVDAATKQLADQRQEIATLEGQVKSQQDLINTLLAQVEHLGAAAPPALKSSAAALREQVFAVKPIQHVDPALLQSASTRLAAARASIAKLSHN